MNSLQVVLADKPLERVCEVRNLGLVYLMLPNWVELLYLHIH